MEGNENCLEGIRCDKCGSSGPFKISATAEFEIDDDGTAEYSDVEWDDLSLIHCKNCDWSGYVYAAKDVKPSGHALVRQLYDRVKAALRLPNLSVAIVGLHFIDDYETDTSPILIKLASKDAATASVSVAEITKAMVGLAFESVYEEQNKMMADVYGRVAKLLEAHKAEEEGETNE